MNRINALLIAGALGLLVASPASSALVTYEVTGTVTSSALAYAPTVSVGDNVSITLVLEDATPDGNPGDGQLGAYDGSVLSALVTAGSWTGTNTAAGLLTVVNDVGGVPRDVLSISTTMTGDLLVNPVVNLRLDWVDRSGSAISDDGFPLLTDFAGVSGSGRLLFSAGAPRINFSLDDITLIPEPTSGVLMGLGLCLLARVRRPAQDGEST